MVYLEKKFSGQSQYLKFPNIDKVLLFILPVVAVSLLSFPNNKVSLYGTILTLAIFFYEILIYPYRNIYGFSGLKIISIPSLMLLTFTAFIAVPGVFITTTKTGPAIVPYFISIVSFYIFFPFGLLLGNHMRTIKYNNVNKLINTVFDNDYLDELLYDLLKILFTICMLIFGLYLIRTDVIPLIELIKNPGDYSNLTTAREQALKLLKVTVFEQYLFSWLRSLFVPFGVIGSVFLVYVYRKRKYFILFLLFLIPGMFINTMTLEKSPIAAIFLSLIAFIFLRENRLNVYFIVGSTLIIFSVPFLIAFFLHFNDENALHVVTITLIHRIFIVPAEVLYLYFDIFPNIHEFLLGQSSHLFSWMYDNGTFPLSNYVFRIWWRSPLATGFANANYLGYFWADFGYLGVFISTFVVGFIFHLIYWKLLSVCDYRKNIIYVTITSVLTPIFSFVFFSSNFTTIFFTRGLALIIFLLFFIDYITKRRMISV